MTQHTTDTVEAMHLLARHGKGALTIAVRYRRAAVDQADASAAQRWARVEALVRRVA